MVKAIIFNKYNGILLDLSYKKIMSIPSLGT